jgi:hypothetical protein
MDDGCKNGMAVGGMEKVVIRHASWQPIRVPFPFFVHYFPFFPPSSLIQLSSLLSV